MLDRTDTQNTVYGMFSDEANKLIEKSVDEFEDGIHNAFMKLMDDMIELKANYGEISDTAVRESVCADIIYRAVKRLVIPTQFKRSASQVIMEECYIRNAPILNKL